jgi:DNA-binding transcriptional MocR family regulator
MPRSWCSGTRANDNSAPHIRLSYVAAPSPADINDAIRRLATAITETAA